MWYNFKIQEFEALENMPEDFQDYIPQIPVALNLYRLYTQDMEYAPLEAARKVLEACVQDKPSLEMVQDDEQPGEPAELGLDKSTIE